MPSTRKMILNHVMSGICSKINRMKKLPNDVIETPPKKCLNTFEIILFGIGHMVGAGIYVLSGTVIKEIAGPGIIISFLLAAIVSSLSALCYAEFGTRAPNIGTTAYAYTYVGIGEFWAFVIGWNIILQHMIGAASVARAFSGYINFLFDGAISNFTIAATGEMHQELLGKYPDILAFLVCIFYAFLLVTGIKGSVIVSNALTLLNLGVMIFIISMEFYYSDISNWTDSNNGLFPFGFSGVISGAAICFYAFIGFDSIATSNKEVRDPSFSIPVATIVSMTVVTLGYVLTCAALTLMVPFDSINPTAAISQAFAAVGIHWVKYVVAIGAACALSTTLFGSLFSLSRCMCSMAQDGILFSFLENVNSKSQVPFTSLAIAGFLSAFNALLFDLEKLVQLMSIGTLLAYTIVSASVIILRFRPTTEMFPKKPATSPSCSDSSSSYSEAPTPVFDFSPVPGTLRPQFGCLSPILGNYRPGRVVATSVFIYTGFSCALSFLLHGSLKNRITDAWWITVTAAVFITIMGLCLLVICAHHQNTSGLKFKVPLVPLLPAFGIFCNLGFMVHLQMLTWIRLFIWLVLGMLVYFLYGIHHSKENEVNSSYSILISSSEAVKDKWGFSTITKTRTKGTLTKRKGSTGDKNPIIDEEEIVQ